MDVSSAGPRRGGWDRHLLVLALACCGVSADCGNSTPPPTTYTAINSQVFAQSCGFTETCHKGNAHGKLDLSVDPYAQLINYTCDNPRAQGEGLLRVKPGDSANSFLY